MLAGKETEGFSPRADATLTNRSVRRGSPNSAAPKVSTAHASAFCNVSVFIPLSPLLFCAPLFFNVRLPYKCQGAPQATQVVDRWHLIANLGDAVEDFLIRAQIRLEDGKASSQKEQAEDKPLSSFSATPSSQRKTQARLLRKWKLYQRVQELHATGMSLRKIGEELGLARNTVRKYFQQAPEAPLPTPRPLRESQLDPYEDYLLQRWSQGERNAAQLHREIRERGYPGSASMVRAYV